MDLKETECGNVVWIQQGHASEKLWFLVNMVRNTLGSIKCKEFDFNETLLAIQKLRVFHGINSLIMMIKQCS